MTGSAVGTVTGLRFAGAGGPRAQGGEVREREKAMKMEGQQSGHSQSTQQSGAALRASGARTVGGARRGSPAPVRSSNVLGWGKWHWLS